MPLSLYGPFMPFFLPYLADQPSVMVILLQEINKKMSKRCFICNKGSISGNCVSHSNIKTKRRWFPNLQKVRIIVKGKVLKEYVCTKCMKSGKIKKAI